MREWKVGDRCEIVETNIEDTVAGEYSGMTGVIEAIEMPKEYGYLVSIPLCGEYFSFWCNIKEIDDEDDLIAKGETLPQDRSGEPETFTLEGEES